MLGGTINGASNPKDGNRLFHALLQGFQLSRHPEIISQGTEQLPDVEFFNRIGHVWTAPLWQGFL